MTFAADAEVPEAWECRTCGAEALLRIGEGTATVDHSEDKVARTHWDMLLERRTIPELEELLEERLAYVRARRGAGEDVTRRASSAPDASVPRRRSLRGPAFSRRRRRG